jgi:hypothetical protein
MPEQRAHRCSNMLEQTAQRRSNATPCFLVLLENSFSSNQTTNDAAHSQYIPQDTQDFPERELCLKDLKIHVDICLVAAKRERTILLPLVFRTKQHPAMTRNTATMLL